jgi:hypothetical protein
MMESRKAKASGTNTSCPSLAIYSRRMIDNSVKASLALKGSFTSFIAKGYIYFIKESKKEQ